MESLERATGRMTEAVAEACGGKLHSVWLYGSAVFGDLRPGWSDIDFLALTEEPIDETQAERLLMLRQHLSEECPEDPLLRSFEGVICCLDEYRRHAFTRLIYWGTSGQRVTAVFPEDPFAQFELARYGLCVYGEPDRSLFSEPEPAALSAEIRRHYETIRRFAQQTDESFYSCGWLLDMARCLYTLRHHDVIAKTRAGEWALENHLFPEEDALEKTLMIRREPLAYKDRPEIREWLAGLGPVVQHCADVLEEELKMCQ